MGYTNATLDSVSLNITNVSPVKKQKKVKQVLGYKVIQIEVLGLSEHQYDLSITGILTGTSSASLDSAREELEDLDDATTHTYVDGLHNGTYYVEPGSISFSDDGSINFSHYNYTIKLIKE